MARQTELNKPAPQAKKMQPQFEAVATELGCPEDEETFDLKLRQIAEAGPLPKHQPKKRSNS